VLTPGWRRVYRALFISGLALKIVSVWVWYAYAGTRPRTPEPTTGHIVALNTHGTIAYLTIGEWALVHAVVVAGFVAIVLGMWVYATRVQPAMSGFERAPDTSRIYLGFLLGAIVIAGFGVLLYLRWLRR
jgi:hypothetical protein